MLTFSSPDQPAALTQPDAGFIQIAFGQVTVDSTKTLTLAFVSLGAPVTLGAVTPLEPDSEFSLPFVANTIVNTAPGQITVGFSPISLGPKTAVFQLAYAAGTQAVIFQLTGEGIANGLTVTPNPLDFGQVEVNQLQTLPLTITNGRAIPATLVLTALKGQDAGGFSLSTLASTSLAPNASTTLDATFGPLLTGPAGSSFTVTGFSTDPPITVNLTGTGAQSWLQTTPLDFGFVPLFHTITKSAVVTNIGSYTTLHLIAPEPLVSQPPGNGGFVLGSPQPSLPITLAPGESASIPVSFIPESLNAYSGTLFLNSDDPGGRYPVVQLEGYGGGPRISCLPEILFGPVPVGAQVSLTELCINAGPTVPSHPELRLQIAQSELSTDNPDFTANLILPDGGLAGAGFSVSLQSGQSAAIDVKFLPRDAGVVEARLAVPSNDLNDADAGVLLVGEGIVPGPCVLDVSPTQLGFGEVPPKSSGQLLFEVDNVGQDFCILGHIALDPHSDAAFSLPGGATSTQVLSFPGNTDNPTALPSSLRVDVQFAPTVAEAAATGAVDIAPADQASPDRTISLTGSSLAACLTLQPTTCDFGRVGLSASTGQVCIPELATFTAENACSMPVTIDQIALAAGLDAVPQFALESQPSLPLTLSAGSQASFAAGFTPTEIGPELEGITVSTSEFPGTPFLVTLEGDAELGGVRTDTFVIPAAVKKLDLLWILDEDDDYPQVQAVAAVLPQLIDSMNQAQIDYQIAVTSTDTCDAGSSDQGAFEPCDHCLSTASSTPTFVTPTAPDPATALVDLFDLFDLAPQVGFCVPFNGDEHFFDSIADAFSPGLLSGHNSGFIREGADLAVILVNGDAEDDANGGWGNGGANGPYLTSLAQVMDLLESLKPDPSMVSLSYINLGAGTLNAAQAIGKLVEATGGIEIDTSQPAAVWQATLLDLLPYTEGSGVFRLGAQPAAPSQIQVYVDGVLTTSWVYLALENSVVLEGMLPTPGSTVAVTYDLGCP